jgi:serine protease AprX
MKQLLPLLAFVFFFINESPAQTRYLVKLKDKGSSPFSFSNPSAYLSQRAIDRRTKYGIAIDSTDLPATPAYVSQIRNVPNVTVLNVSKWLNSVSIQTSDASAITTITGFPFVQSVTALAARTAGREAGDDKFRTEEVTEINTTEQTEEIFADYYNYGANSYAEINLHKAQFLHNIGLRGQGIRMALLDAGFTGFATLRSFDSMNLNNRVLETWDFVSRHADVNDHSHGMQCLSTIAANIPGQFVGKAPEASFYLYRTEDAPTEYPIEEHNWACGAERADSIGADMISTSLGYTDYDPPLTASSHTYADMNGNTTMAAIAADLAAKKGMLVFASVGNDGNSAWRFLSTPSDGDSVVAVGAVNASGAVASFSSYGPSSDGRIKPDVASIGSSAVVQTSNNTIGFSNGTSFSCPNMAGMAACLWQGFPEYNNMKIVNTIQQAGSIATTPNDRIGYGIPDMKKAFSDLLVEYATSSAVLNGCNATLSWNSKDVSAMKYEIERKTPGSTDYVKIAELSPQPGAVLTNRSYQLVHTLSNVAAGTISFRIRQIIDTAIATFTALYIDTADVSLASDCVATTPVNIVKVLPNPSSGEISLEVETSFAVTSMPVRIYDAMGRLVDKLQFSKGIGTSRFSLPSGRYAKGIYFIAVYNGEKLLGNCSMIRL